MKSLDKFIRYWRVHVALRHIPQSMESVFDIGCDDGYLLEKLSSITMRQDGIDPRVVAEQILGGSEIRKGYFPAAIADNQMQGLYDAIFALAVFEHFSEEDLRKSASVIARMLSPTGRLIVTVPNPLVDHILDVLVFFRLIEGQALEEHHGFDPNCLVEYFSGHLRLLKHRKFQLGLNNIYIFERL